MVEVVHGGITRSVGSGIAVAADGANCAVRYLLLLAEHQAWLEETHAAAVSERREGLQRARQAVEDAAAPAAAAAAAAMERMESAAAGLVATGRGDATALRAIARELRSRCSSA